MEKAPGIQLFERRDQMSEYAKMELAKSLVGFERQWSAINFPAYGGLYLRGDADLRDSRYKVVDKSIDPLELFGIGTSCDRSIEDGGDGHLDQGPCKSPHFHMANIC